MGDSLDISALRSTAKAFREDARALLAKADAIDNHIDALLELTGTGSAARRRKSASNAGAGGGSVGKKPGTMSFKWREHLAAIGGKVGPQFTNKQVIKRVKSAEGRDMRASEVRRQFKVYVEHGYLETVDGDTYRMTPKLVSLLEQLRQNEGPPAEAEGPLGGDVAERSIAPDSNSGGDSAYQASAPVGSNPTVSAQPMADVLSELGLTPNIHDQEDKGD